jgi:hypothetical protein
LPATVGTFLRSFTFGHVRQLDRVLAESLRRAWQAGAGPGEERLVIDLDSFVGEVHGYAKEGAAYGYTRKLGYHPLLATRAGTEETLHVQLRKGSANTQRGAPRFVDELIARVRRAGATGAILLRADSGSWNKKLTAKLRAKGRLYSIGVRAQAHVVRRSRRSPRRRGSRWPTTRQPARRISPRPSSAATGPVVRRVRTLDAQQQPFATWQHFAFITNRDEPLELVEREHREHAVVELVIRDLKTRRSPTSRWTLHLPARWPWHRRHRRARAHPRAPRARLSSARPPVRQPRTTTPAAHTRERALHRFNPAAVADLSNADTRAKRSQPPTSSTNRPSAAPISAKRWIEAEHEQRASGRRAATPRHKMGAMRRRLPRVLMLAVLCGAVASASSAAAVANDYLLVLGQRASLYRYQSLASDRSGRAYAAALKAFGKPTRLQAKRNVCRATWARAGISIELVSAPPACTSMALYSSSWQSLSLFGERWHTARGLRVGDSIGKAQRLYPRATFDRRLGQRLLVLVRERAAEADVVQLAAVVDRRGRIASLEVPSADE